MGRAFIVICDALIPVLLYSAQAAPQDNNCTECHEAMVDKSEL